MVPSPPNCHGIEPSHSEEISFPTSQRAVVTMTDADRTLEPFVHRLPLDIMQEIFISCLPTKHYAVLSLDHAPLLLCRICRSWRALAHSLPRLWSTLHIPLGLSSSAAAFPIRGSPEMPLELMRRVLVAVKSWLKRSGTFPLSLSMKIFPDMVATHRTAQFLEFLMKSSSRWKAITLTGNRSVEKFLAVSRTLDRFPILEELTIRMHTGGPSAGMWDLLRVPTLRRVSLKFDILQPLELPLLWAEFTDLELNCAIPWHRDAICLTVAGAIELLQRCHCLQNCTLHVIHRGVPPASLPIVTLRSMHSLCLFQSFGVTRLLEHVLMPNLRIFRLRRHRIQSGGVDTSLSLHTLLGVSSKLQTLDLSLNCMTKQCLLALLPALAYITHLTIAGYSMLNEPVSNRSLPLAVFDDNILRLLTETTGSGPAVHRSCPLLESIRMENMEAISDAALLAFIQSRMASGSTLRRVGVTMLRPKHLDILPSLRSYLSAGLQLSLRYADAQRHVAPTCGEVLPTTGFSPIIGTGPGLSVVL